MCGYAWRYLLFFTSPQNPWLASFISRAQVTIFWACCNFEDAQSQHPLPSWLSHGMATWVPKGSSTSRPGSCATPSSARGTLAEEKPYFSLVPSVFILLSEGVCLQTYHSAVTRCKSTCSNLCGLWQILVFHSWRPARTKGTPTHRALLALVWCCY